MTLLTKKEKKLKTTEPFVRSAKNAAAIFESFPYPIGIASRDGKLIYANLAMWQNMGYSEKEKIDINIRDVYADPMEREELLEILKKEGKAVNFRTHFKCRDGNIREFFLNSRMMKFDGQDCILVIISGTEELQAAQQELKEKYEEIEAFYKNSSDAIMRLAPPSWKFTAGNPATVKMFAVRDEKEFDAMAPWELSPEYQPDGQLSSVKAKEMIEKAMKEGSNFFEWTHKKHTGEEFFATVFLIRVGTDPKVSLLAIVRDISEQKKEEEILRNFAETTRAKISEIIPTVQKIPLDMPPQGSGEFHYLLSVMDEMINTLKERNIHLEHTRKAMASLAEDFSLEKQKLAASKTQIETIITSIGDGVIVINGDGVVTLFNPTAEKISGLSSSEIVGKKCCDVVHFYSDEKDETPSELIKETIRTGVSKKLGLPAVLKRKDGVKVPISDSISPLKDADGKILGCVVVFSDASAEREIDRAKSEFVSLASHQLRTPISTVAWFIEMLLTGEVGEVNDKQREYLEEVNRSNQRMGAMVSMLLNISRIEMGTFIIEPRLTDMEKLIDASLSSIRPLLEKKGLAVEKKIEKDLPLVNADQKLLGIVMDNLLSNSLSYTPTGGKITVFVTKNESDMQIAVSDDGIGIPEAAQPKMFSKLFRADNAKEIDTDGTGIGLYMTKSIVEGWKGTIRFESPIKTKMSPGGKEEKVGTSFFVTVPISGMIKKEGTAELLAK